MGGPRTDADPPRLTGCKATPCPAAAAPVPHLPCRALRPVPAQFTTQGVWMVPWAVSTAYTLFTPKSSALTWMPVTGQFSMIWWQRKGSSNGRVARAAGQPGSPDIWPPNLGKVNLSSGLALAVSLSQHLLLLPPVVTCFSLTTGSNRCSVRPQLQRMFIIYMGRSEATHQGQAHSPCLKD